MNERVDASIRYAIDVERPGMLHARLVRAPLAPARVVAVDASGVPGDAVCLLPEDVRDLARYGCIIRDQDVLPQGPVRHVGEPVAAVAAATERAARAAAELVLVEVRVPPQPAVAAYRKFRSRHAEDRPCVGVALAAGRDGAGRVQGLRLVVGAVSGRPQELPEACALAEGQVVDEPLAAEIARRYAAGLDPIDDARGSSAYRRRIVEVEVRRALAGAAA